ncbi:MAG: NrtA/SsuA/CpmA family ABC transporter substrate-binding protein [Zoogloeaceae bacterium]|jgi:ABC-type nitrate/sulfonate/bicarbonate transport system substrate-binding protein|nr:NrtA/SsuA/CpmA family ABC transporter substrate-binding protein [Zoogloeaceae bacterium]
MFLIRTLHHPTLRNLLAGIGIALASTGHANDAIPIRIAYPQALNGQIPLVLDKSGIAKSHGLDAWYTFFQNGPPMMEALAAGSVDVVVSSYQPFAVFISRQPGKATPVANLGHASYSLLTPKEAKENSLADLKGKRIALSFGSDSHLDLLRSIRKFGLDPASDFKLLHMAPNELNLALNQGFADAAVIRQPQARRLEREFGLRNVQTWPHYFLVIASSEFLARQPTAKERLLDALRETVVYITRNEDRAAEWFGERLRLSPAIIKELSAQNPLFKDVKNADDVHIEFDAAYRQSINDWLAASFENGLIKNRVEPLKEQEDNQ